ncbi:ABC transporter ATP-binding protein [Sporomusa sphaeroides]|uniref:Lipid A export ATP-binding/permease protein MsbA n=1 Tax=Sporomusa sphaeroides DSM 2875 TaxID=1337886 RepID=A0ABM9W4R1_9FIRM|nr:ABC transporter ATP-binding protein [Sporomusa sphaeroides]OLS57245.1 lipid A export ATP-binding/permease protein MsbA [Sporomusa sphaeroides DSM 2875]CVK20147.1 Lipid A export ATP-binding/permease protein MsbA [Sporomusa sphaeroides DSM 2875]
MFKIINRLLTLAGEYSQRIKFAFFLSTFEAFLGQVPILTVLVVLIKISANDITVRDAQLVALVIVLSIIVRALLKRWIDGLQSSTGYEIFARERLKLGDRLKRLPMGYFSNGNIGKITAVVTSDLVFIEEHSMSVLSKVVSCYLGIAVSVILLFRFDYRIGFISLFTFILASLALKQVEKVIVVRADDRQESQSRLISAVLEYVKGISVIKSFNMTEERTERIYQEFKNHRDVNINFEEEFIPPSINFDRALALGTTLTVFASAYFYFNKTMELSMLLVMMIFAFQIYLPFKTINVLSVMINIMKNALDRFDSICNIENVDKDGKDIVVNKFDIEFNNVSFAYEQEQVIHNVSFVVPENSMTALVGKSGSGKTTIANLIARFWDIQGGAIKIGGVDSKEMTFDSLLKNISMVFQDVYLFNDTILNNLRLAKPEATLSEIMEVCKKACCHDFIMELPNGYDTIVGEGGSSLSGGEKQRISIARAILKDAPIILLDEATASLDPDNEKQIQAAISELVRNKTLVVIAHRLSTIKEADQILVLDKGRIVQQGVHEKLIEVDGQYKDFWQRRMQAGSWKISQV